jgi:hypothetical protein
MVEMAVMAGNECAARPVGSRRGGKLMGLMDETCSRIRDGITAAIVLREQAVRK